MHREIEALLFVRADSIIVDGSADMLRRAWLNRTQYQHAPDGRQTNHCAAGTVCDPDDEQPATAMIEKLLYSRTEATALPGAAKSTTKGRVAVYKNGSVEGAAKRTTNKSCRRICSYVDGLIHRRDFSDRNAPV